MSDGLSWFYSFLNNFVTNCNFQVVNGVKFLDMMIVLFLMGLVIRNFVHSAK